MVNQSEVGLFESTETYERLKSNIHITYASIIPQ